MYDWASHRNYFTRGYSNEQLGLYFNCRIYTGAIKA